MRNVLTVILFMTVQVVIAQPHTHQSQRSFKFPDFNGLKTLKCDFHQHTVFSDGSVWPDIRVKEALLDGLDAISLTEHLEYQPHKQDIPHPDRNRSYEIATKEAKDHNLLIIKGSEITRSMPPGHNNAIFINDANKLLIDSAMGVFRAAQQQGAFVFWNHPNWVAQRPDGVAKLTDMHRQLFKENLLQGIEVVNEHTFSDEALQIALDNNLTIMGTSDVHQLIDWDYNVPNNHRPITLIFAKEKTPEEIKSALIERKTVACFKDLLIGREEMVKPLIEASIVITNAEYQKGSSILNVSLKNQSSCNFILKNSSKYQFHNQGDIITVPADGEVVLQVKTLSKVQEIFLKFEVLNGIIAPNKHPLIEWKYSSVK